MSKLKVAICTDGIYPHMLGGMQKHSRLLVETLAQYDDLDITVIHPHLFTVFESDFIREIQIEGIDVNRNYLFECYSYSKRVFKELTILKPDIVYSQGLSVWFNAKELRGKLIINPHGLEPFQTTGLKGRMLSFPIREIFKYLFRRATIVISLGGKLTKILKNRHLRISKIFEIPNAVLAPSAGSKNADNDNVVRVLFLARFASNKGIEVLFAAINELKNQNLLQRFEFTLGGTGPLYPYYKERNDYENVILPGFIPDDKISRLYLANDLFVFPTLYEGMPTVVLEAMSYGLPVIVTDVGATSVLVDHNNGRMISPGSVNELVDSLKWFLSLTVDQRRELSRNSFAKFREKYAWPIVAEQYYKLFKMLLVLE